MVSSTAATTTGPSRPRPGRPNIRRTSHGSFHAGNIIPHYDSYGSIGSRRAVPSLATIRRQSSHRYHTFPTPPPKTPSDRPEPRFGGQNDGADDSDDNSEDGSDEDDATPLPWRQLGLLALLSLAEQTALNSISPYLPTMVASFDGISESQVGLYVGLLASAFAMAQLATNFMWGYFSDTVGRKPVMLVGTALLAGCFIFFGLCRNYAQLIAVHVAMGLLNGNAAVVPTCLGEVTDRTNQSRAFTWLPVIYSIGGITGPALGGLLVKLDGVAEIDLSSYPFLIPNIVSSVCLLVAVVVLAIWFDETLDDAEKKASRAGFAWVEKIFNWQRLVRKRPETNRRWSARWPTRDQNRPMPIEEEDEDSEGNGSDEGQGLLETVRGATQDDDDKLGDKSKSTMRQLANRRTLTVLLTYLVFQLSNISFNSLYPIFASALPPTGRSLDPSTIGLSLSFAGLGTILFQIFLFQPLKTRLGNLGTYRLAMLGIAVAMALMPWVGYLDRGEGLGSGKNWLYGELGVILVLKNIAAVGGLSSVMLLITNSAPSHESLGTLNGVAQTLSAAGRSVGPFLSGALFSLSEHVQPKGEALAWGLFAGICLAGWLGTFLMSSTGLESSDWMGEDEEEEEDGSDEEAQTGR